MSHKLHHIQNWEELAQQANWSVKNLAKQSGVSTRTLERHFIATMGKPPKLWLVENRQNLAAQLLDMGYTVKETASYLGYNYSQHLSRGFKHHYGRNPTDEVNPNQRPETCRILV